MMVGDGYGGVGSTDINLIIGKIDGFAETTLTSAPYTCSGLHQNGGRYGHAAVMLNDGRVFISGGIRPLGSNTEEILATVEIFDPSTGEHRLIMDSNSIDQTPLKMWASSGRAFHTATLLRDGRVLLTGGIGLIEGRWTALGFSEIFDPVSETFPQHGVSQVIGNRAHHTTTLLDSGKVFVAGGVTYSKKDEISSYYNSAEIYDPTTNSWTQVNNNMIKYRAFHQAVKSSSIGGKVVIFGGEDGSGPHASIDIFDPNEQRFFLIDPDDLEEDEIMQKPRSRHCAIALANGEILIAGGKTSKDDTTVDNGVEIYSPSAGKFKNPTNGTTTSLTIARMDHTCTLLDSGNVLVAGGRTSNGVAISVGEKVFIGNDSYSTSELPSPYMAPPRFLHTATKLRNGWIYFSGGLPDSASDSEAITQSLFFVPPPSTCE
jgi:hypothetical protein